MKTHQLRALVAVSATGSINGAAKELHVTQPAISKAIQELESEFGVRLFERTPWGVVPTPEGDALLGRARSIVRELERAHEDIAHLKGMRDGKLVIGFTPIVAVTGFADAFAEFRRHWPEMTFDLRELSPTQLSEQLRNRTVDLAFVAMMRPIPESADIKAIWSFETLFVTRRGGRFAGATSLDALQEAEWIHTDPGDHFPSFIRDVHAQAGLPVPRRITRCTSYALYYSLLVTIDAIFPLSRHTLVETALFDRTLTPLALPVAPPSQQLYLFTPPGLQPPRPASSFLECLRDAFSSKVQPRH
ncbi:LysR family transcriptional regulator [Burkholderia sp. TSV86]|uniref:LysR family transcriptional regulator n=1 Tax=Burkholderia sp. TSV86 TaxID=1385594 RepID=UPI000758CD18|nr:LysR family transcriptional regulator [Burkholderia sp. TSV86]KVE36479.1 LysR family transcriptional regulator [Burkholderia sp. TSV86]